MAEVAFHFNVPERTAYTCRLLRKVWRSGQRAHVVLDAAALHALDMALWTFAADEFVPHATQHAPAHVLAQSPIVLADEGFPPPPGAVRVNLLPHVRGTVSMARLGNNVNSANSQFFIVFYPRFSLDRHYTNYGRVIAGMDAVDAIARGEPPANPTRILQATIAADNVPQLMPVAPRAQAQEITPAMLNASVGN